MTDRATFSNKVVFITGAGSGIGLATAQAFAREGAQLVLVGRKENPLQEAAASISKEGHLAPLVIANCDVADETHVKTALKQVFEKFGRLDIAFNNAGMVGALGALAEVESKDYQRLMQVNVDGVFFSMKHEIPLMLKTLEKFGREAGSGGQCRIINTSSCAGLLGFTGSFAYVASKFAVNGLTKSAALDYAQAGIAINAVAPGPVETPLVNQFASGEAHKQELLKTVPMRHYGVPEDIAELVLGLCSPKMKFMTGTVVSADGGQTAGY
ncbi:short-chain dehydrogenase reductase sdr [Lasius niger]|uniref:Short-chain dehydrogenase reductase sdr n=1 Tax=Lasius niger TaxID=67767 RepID=A0A0J7KNE9_LASNI|nr:short-chain dehydrogenase reductase sdr [Lasius niger]